MEVRDAVEADVDALAAIADAPADVMRNLIHDRAVRVAVRDQPERDPNVDVGVETADLLGFLSFDAHEETVYVTQLAGTTDACERLLAEPMRFAATESMAVQLLVAASDEEVREAAERVGFEKQGPGPMFEGERTVRYRITP